MSTLPAVRDRRAPVPPERLRPELDPGRGLAALVLRPVDERDRPLDDARRRTPRAAPPESDPPRRTPPAQGRATSYGGIESASRWSSRSSALGARSIVVRGISSRPARSLRCSCEPVDIRLEDVLQEREATDHVPVERRVADRELRLVPGRDDEPAVGVRQRHEEHAADTRLQVLGGEAREAARVLASSAAWNATTASSIGISRKVQPRLSAIARASSRVPSEENREGIETQ